MDNKLIIQKFYTAFQAKDWKGMQACYHPEVRFSDPVFPVLQGKKVGAMWHMLLSASTDLTIKFEGVASDHDKGSCHWEAWYSFSKTGRKVHNSIDATFKFQDGLIIDHQDSFDLWKWSRMALGIPGLLLGWSTYLREKIQAMAGDNLGKFIVKNPDYQ